MRGPIKMGTDTLPGSMTLRFYDVFMCHRRHDSAKLSVGIHTYLNRQGVRTFCDLVDDPGYALGDKIYDLIRSTPIFLLVASGGALASLICTESWVRQEFDCAITSQRKLISVQVGSFKDCSLETLPKYVLDLLARPKVVLNSSAPSTSAFSSLLDSITFSPNPNAQDILDSLLLTAKDVSELIIGVCNTIIGSLRPSESVLNGFVERCFGKHRSRATARYLIAAENKLNNAQERSIIRRAIFVSLLRSLSRDQSRSRHASDIRMLWPLLFSTLNRESGLTIQATQSAQGFVVVPLYSVLLDGQIRELLRLHIWTPMTKNQHRNGLNGDLTASALNRFAVHSHQPHARSWLLAGELRNTIYRVSRIDRGDSKREGHALFSVSWDGHRRYDVYHTSSRVTNTGQCVQVEPECSAHFESGESYVLPAGEFHDTTAIFGDHAAPLAATLFFFDASKGWVEDAAVVGPSNIGYSDCPRSFETDVYALLDKLDQSIRVVNDKCR